MDAENVRDYELEADANGRRHWSRLPKEKRLDHPHETIDKLLDVLHMRVEHLNINICVCMPYEGAHGGAHRGRCAPGHESGGGYAHG